MAQIKHCVCVRCHFGSSHASPKCILCTWQLVNNLIQMWDANSHPAEASALSTMSVGACGSDECYPGPPHELVCQFSECVADLRKVQEAFSAAFEVESKNVLRVIERLSKLPMTPEALKESGAGKAINDRSVRLHGNELVRARSKELVHSWKARIAALTAPPSPSVETPASGEERSAGREALCGDVATLAASAVNPRSPRKRKAVGGDDAAAAQFKKKETYKGVAAALRAHPNEALAALFKELSHFEFKQSQPLSVAYMLVADTLRAHPDKIVNGVDAQQLPNIGRETGKKINEFLSTGRIERLEEYRRGEFN